MPALADFKFILLRSKAVNADLTFECKPRNVVFRWRKTLGKYNGSTSKQTCQQKGESYQNKEKSVCIYKVLKSPLHEPQID